MSLAAVVVNFNTAELSLKCVDSLLAQAEVARIIVIDNGSVAEDHARLRAACGGQQRIAVVRSERNVGFASGCNVGIALALEDSGINSVLCLNSDATLAPNAAAMLAEAAHSNPATGLAGGRVHKPDGSVDSLGIAFYLSCLASNRVQESDAYFGPTGGCALYRRDLLEALLRRDGYFFDPEFFCYAEDTDLAARALLLGFQPAYVPRLIATHIGQMSSGGGFNDFVLYHGIRNSIWMMVKCVPTALILVTSPLVIALHIAIILRQSLRGKVTVVFRLYRDALRRMPLMLERRRVVQRSRTISLRGFSGYITFKFYDISYLRRSLRELWR